MWECQRAWVGDDSHKKPHAPSDITEGFFIRNTP